ncbi:MAG: M23 family metallopeptidase [Crocinitomicaceae bacterium]|nr:M23 family metallopeptidase [Crocinitomicaceae bacterium]
MKTIIFLISLILLACTNSSDSYTTSSIQATSLVMDTLRVKNEHIADHFDFPVGKPNAKGYYNAQGFGKNAHLGDDWNGLGGGNSDLGDPIYAVANGFVTIAKDEHGGWGNVIRISHFLSNGIKVESLYAHCDTILICENRWVNRGDQIGTIGNAHGQYLAHLHFEMRDVIGMPIGGGYSRNTNGYIDPTAFIKAHR